MLAWENALVRENFASDSIAEEAGVTEQRQRGRQSRLQKRRELREATHLFVTRGNVEVRTLRQGKNSALDPLS